MQKTAYDLRISDWSSDVFSSDLAIAKTIILGMVSAISDEKDRNRYRLEHQLVRPSRRDDITLGLAKKLENFIGNISRRVDAGESFDDFSPLVELICRSYNPGWLIVDRRSEARCLGKE